MKITLRTKITSMLSSLSREFLEREDAVRLAILALLSRQPLLFAGPTSTAKSSIIHAMASFFKDAKYFHVLLSPSLPIDAVFGAINPNKMMEGEFCRDTAMYLPGADFAFLDETFNAGPHVLMGLLNVINERQFVNGSKREIVKANIFFASNLIPRNSELGPIVDRMTIKCNIGRVQREDNLLKIAESWNGKGALTENSRRTNFSDAYVPPGGATLSMDELDEASESVRGIQMEKGLLAKAVSIVADVRGAGVDVSERKLKNSMRAVAANAWLDGRDEAGLADLLVFCSTFWNQPSEEHVVMEKVMHSVDRNLAGIHVSFQKMVEGFRNIQSAQPKDSAWRKRCAAEHAVFDRIYAEMETLSANVPKVISDNGATEEKIHSMLTTARYMKGKLAVWSNTKAYQDAGMDNRGEKP